MNFEPTDDVIIAIAEKYGKTPDEIENMSVYWLNRTILMMDAQALDAQRRDDDRPKT